MLVWVCACARACVHVSVYVCVCVFIYIPYWQNNFIQFADADINNSPLAWGGSNEGLVVFKTLWREGEGGGVRVRDKEREREEKREGGRNLWLKWHKGQHFDTNSWWVFQGKVGGHRLTSCHSHAFLKIHFICLCVTIKWWAENHGKPLNSGQSEEKETSTMLVDRESWV